MNRVESEARAWLQRALLASFAGSDEYGAQTLEEYGDALFAIAELFDIPDEARIQWVYDKPPHKDWSLASWRRWCEKYADLRAQLPPGAPLEPEAPESREERLRTAPEEPPAARMLCPRCYASEAQQIGETWFCANCGNVS